MLPFHDMAGTAFNDLTSENPALANATRHDQAVITAFRSDPQRHLAAEQAFQRTFIHKPLDLVVPIRVVGQQEPLGVVGHEFLDPSVMECERAVKLRSFENNGAEGVLRSDVFKSERVADPRGRAFEPNEPRFPARAFHAVRDLFNGGIGACRWTQRPQCGRDAVAPRCSAPHQSAEKRAQENEASHRSDLRFLAGCVKLLPLSKLSMETMEKARIK
jgi:hypothetical protein